ncbi:ABC transporter permease [Algoriphagus aestuariicola]|uniref:ABC transporter permease n=1 Tax=Algoriphagus aestuariicola TaxID=1852016 RepID=A0ABS3BNQ4_9BACT|nr:ABC transporter permease [Algoriphagus aestuariicola]MBN7800536.1 ABC transporter permease [Algoriphagus aestuariicola]
MLKNNLKIAKRILWKNKLFSLINILSLSLSMAVGVILFTFIKATLDTDHFHPELNHLVRILTQETNEGEQTKWATAPLPLAPLLENISFVEKTVKVRLAGKHNLQTDKGDVPLDIVFSEPSFFDVFGFNLLSGNAQSLTNNTSLFLTEKAAKKIFGNTNALGQTVQIENLGSYTVEGIIQDPPLETHLPLEAMLSINSAEMLEKEGAISNISQSWGDFKSSTIYARLNSENDVKQLNTTLQNYNRRLEKSNLQFLAQPIEDITPQYKDIKNDANAGGSWEGIKLQLLMILSITLLSAFNYISLALARAFSRAKEVGVRKTIGVTRRQIIGQFLIESTLVSLLALLFTVPCVMILMNYIPDPDFKVAFSLDVTLILGLLTYAIITGLVAGAFPSWLLSAFRPTQILRKMKNIKLFRGVAVYKGLIVLQFSVTIMLMIQVVMLADYELKSSAIIESTVPANVLTLDLKGEKYNNLLNDINRLSQVETTLATNWYHKPMKLGKSSVSLNDKILEINYVSIDPKTIETEGIRLISGENFPDDMPLSSEQYVLVNEEAAKLLKSESETLVGQNLMLDSAYVQVIGIMPNEIIDEQRPLMYRYLPNEISTLIIKTKPDTELVAAEAIQTLWNKNFPEKTANLHNLKEHHYSGSSSGDRIGIFGGLALIVYIIAGLGILGVASYSVEIRTKELGIRKLMGSSNAKLVWTATRNFGILMLIAGLIGVPAGFFVGDLIRQDLGSNLVNLSFLNISIGFALVAVLGLMIVLSQTIRAGQIEPVKVLKAE